MLPNPYGPNQTGAPGYPAGPTNNSGSQMAPGIGFQTGYPPQQPTLSYPYGTGGAYGQPPIGGQYPQPSGQYPQAPGQYGVQPGGYQPNPYQSPPANYGGQSVGGYGQPYGQPSVGGQYPQQGGQYPQPSGQFQQPGGQFPQPSGQFSQAGGQYGAQQGGYPQIGGGPASNYGGQSTGSHSSMTFGGTFPAAATGGFNPTPTMAYNLTPFQGTVKPAATFNASVDCELLKKAMKGLGCDDKAVINVLCYRSNAQRQQIRSTFKTMYGKDLIKELISELRGNLEDVIVALLYTPGEYDACELRQAMAGAGTTESTLIEIMATRSNDEIKAIKLAYHTMFGKDLEKALISETSGNFKKLLVSLCNASRDESMEVNVARARKSAQDLHQAGVKRWGTDESTFNAILCINSYTQLQAIFDEYRKLAGHDIEQAIKGEFSGDIEDGLMTIVKSAKNPGAYFAERLYKSMIGLGTNDRALIRAVVTRCEKDMVQIKQEFQRMYGKTLESFITGDTSGKYKDALLALVRGN